MPHGGAGRGQGRKPLHPAPMAQTTVRLSETDMTLLSELGGGNTSKGIRHLCQWYVLQTKPRP
jgi:hypothetical protein